MCIGGAVAGVLALLARLRVVVELDEGGVHLLDHSLVLPGRSMIGCCIVLISWGVYAWLIDFVWGAFTSSYSLDVLLRC